MAGKRREEAKRTQAMEDAAAAQGDIIEILRRVETKLDAVLKNLSKSKPAPKTDESPVN